MKPGEIINKEGSIELNKTSNSDYMFSAEQKKLLFTKFRRRTCLASFKALAFAHVIAGHNRGANASLGGGFMESWHI